jgi:5-methylthioadenosine/S-adenosylhomocysteine deaminase
MADSEDSAPTTRWSRRTLLRGGGAVGALAVAGGAVAIGTAQVAERGEELTPGRPLLLRGGTVLTMDPARGTLADADVLVERGRISAVGPGLAQPRDAAVLDVRGQLVLPGMIDTHRHMWQTVLRGIGADWTLSTYFEFMFGHFAPSYTPEDMYAASLLGALEALDAGVTTVVDWSHNMRTPQHADAVVDALLASGARARLAYGHGDGTRPANDWVLEGDVARLRDERFPTAEDRVTLQIALDLYDSALPERPALEWARDRGFEITAHAGYPADVPERLREAGLLAPSMVFVHAAGFTDASYRAIAEAGATVSVAAESELQGGGGYPPTEKLRRFGVAASLSGDTMAWYGGDMFSAMRATLSADRGLAHLRTEERGGTVEHNAMHAVNALEMATTGGARSVGLLDELGSLTPGKRADVVVLDTTSAGMSPLVNPVGAAVLQASRADVDTVLVDGRVVKRAGRLVGDGLARARQLAEASRDRLRAAVGEEVWSAALNRPRP